MEVTDIDSIRIGRERDISERWIETATQIEELNDCLNVGNGIWNHHNTSQKIITEAWNLHQLRCIRYNKTASSPSRNGDFDN